MQYRPIEDLRHKFAGEAVGLFCGIAKPGQFIETVQGLGAKVIATYQVGDHRPISPEMLRVFATRAASHGAKRLVCTEKDAVKLPPNLSLPLEITPVRMELSLLDGQEAWDALLLRVKKRASAPD